MTTTAATGPTQAAARAPSEVSAEAFAERLFHSVLGTCEMLSVYVGERLGWYAALRDHGALTAHELASRTATDPRYCREWLELQATYGLLGLVPAGTGESRFALPSGAAEVLLDEHSLSYLGALPRMFAAAARQLDPLLEAYRHGGGVSWQALGPDARESQGALNRPWFEQRLAAALGSVAEVEAVLSRPGARIVDVGCGVGWSTLALAEAYPESRVVGLDVDAPSVETARASVAAAGLTDRVEVHLTGGEELAELVGGGLDAVFCFECLHDMARPVEVLQQIRRAVGEDGLVVVMDEAVADSLEAPGQEVDRFMYGCSLFVCLPDGLSSRPSEGTGTVLRPDVLARYAARAGYREVSVLPIDDFGFFGFYRLHP